MADDNKILMELDLESDSFNSKLSSAGSELNKLGESGKKSFEGIGGSALELNAILELGIKAFEVTKEVFKEVISESIDAAMNEEKSIVSLNLAISNSNWASEEASKSMLEFSETMSKSSTMSKEMLNTLEAQAINMSKTEEQAKKLTRAAVELSAATGRDAASSMQVLAMSMQGMTRGLDRIVPGMKNLSTSQLEAGAAADLIIQKFGGSAQAITETFGGRVQNLKKSFEDLHVSIGDAITQSPMINRALEGITILIDKVTSRIEEWVKGGGIEQILNAMLTLGDGVIKYVIAPLELAYNIGKTLFDTIVLGANTVIATFTNVGGMIVLSLVVPIEKGLKLIGDAVGIFSDDIGKKINSAVDSIAGGIKEITVNAAQSTTEVMKDSSDKVNKDMENMFSFSFSSQLSQRMEEIRVFFEGAKKPFNGLKESADSTAKSWGSLGDAFGAMKDGMSAKAKELNDNFTKNFDHMGQTMFNTMGAGAGKAFSALGKAMATGQNGLKAFTDSIISTMGQMAVQLGTEFILQGAAMMWADNPKGVPMMEAGAALAAFGGAMSAFGGGGAATSSATGGGGAATGVAAPTTTPTQSAQPVQSKQAAIVINGDFLNSRETANHLAEVLRQNSDITDYTITAQGRSYA